MPPATVDSLTLATLPVVEGAEGNLTALESGRQIPFEFVRTFYVWGAPKGTIRGRHAHYECHQFFICLHGVCAFYCDDGINRRKFVFDSPGLGLHIPPGIWGEQEYMHDGTVALVLCDRGYDPADYIRDYRQFLRFRGITAE